jgi:hypothetical protein
VSLFDVEDQSEAETWNPFGEEFEVPASAGEPNGKRRPHFNKYNGRYDDLPPVPGYEKIKTWTRVSTLKTTLEDQSLLDAWKRRQVLLGIKNDTRLLGEIGPQLDPSTRFGRDKLNSLCERAMTAAGSHDGAEKGSDLHSLIEVDHASPINIDTLDDEARRWFREYRRTLVEGEISILPEYVERTVVIPEIGCAGTLDMIVNHRGKLRIGDLKSQKTLIFGQMGLCIQLACYSRASYMLDETSWTWKDMPQVEQDAGVIIWVPAIEPEQAASKRVDLDFGWAMALKSREVRKDRTRKGIVTDW